MQSPRDPSFFRPRNAQVTAEIIALQFVPRRRSLPLILVPGAKLVQRLLIIPLRVS